MMIHLEEFLLYPLFILLLLYLAETVTEFQAFTQLCFL